MRKLMVILAMITIACAGLSPVLFAQTDEAQKPLISISKEAGTKLKTPGIVALFLSGNDTLLTRIAEDALAIHLTNATFSVVNREKLEKSIGQQLAIKRKAKEDESINALDIGKAVNASLILTGTVIVESVDEKSLLVKIASFQLLDVAAEKTLISFLSEPEMGKSFSEITKDFVDVIKQNMK